MFNQNLVANALSITLFLVSLFISIRAFLLYVQARNRRLFILGLSMGVISLTAAAGFAGDNVTAIPLNVDWFNYIGQTISFLFFFLSFLNGSDDYQRRLIRVQIAFSAVLLLLLLLAPILPADFPNPAVTKSLLSGSRGVICLLIFGCYVAAFMSKETRFSLLMAGAFLLISIGYLIILPKYFSIGGSLNLDLLDHIGDLTRVCGLGTLLTAILWG